MVAGYGKMKVPVQATVASAHRPQPAMLTELIPLLAALLTNGHGWRALEQEPAGGFNVMQRSADLIRTRLQNSRAASLKP
jgi:hypothetical protein